MDFIIQNFQEFLTYTGFANATAGNLIMILVGIVCIWLAIKKDFEPLLLVPIGLGIILGNNVTEGPIKNCASSGTGYYYKVTNANDLNAAFEEIAKLISPLRLTE